MDLTPPTPPGADPAAFWQSWGALFASVAIVAAPFVAIWRSFTGAISKRFDRMDTRMTELERAQRQTEQRIAALEHVVHEVAEMRAEQKNGLAEILRRMDEDDRRARRQD